MVAAEGVEDAGERGERVEGEGVVLPEELLEEERAALALLDPAGVEGVCPVLELERERGVVQRGKEEEKRGEEERERLAHGGGVVGTGQLLQHGVEEGVAVGRGGRTLCPCVDAGGSALHHARLPRCIDAVVQHGELEEVLKALVRLEVHTATCGKGLQEKRIAPLY